MGKTAFIPVFTNPVIAVLWKKLPARAPNSLQALSRTVLWRVLRIRHRVKDHLHCEPRTAALLTRCELVFVVLFVHRELYKCSKCQDLCRNLKGSDSVVRKGLCLLCDDKSSREVQARRTGIKSQRFILVGSRQVQPMKRGWRWN